MTKQRTDGCQLGVLLHDLSLMEQRNEGLVGSLDQHELEGVPIESHALKGMSNGVKSRTACDCMP